MILYHIYGTLLQNGGNRFGEVCGAGFVAALLKGRYGRQIALGSVGKAGCHYVKLGEGFS